MSEVLQLTGVTKGNLAFCISLRNVYRRVGIFEFIYRCNKSTTLPIAFYFNSYIKWFDVLDSHMNEQLRQLYLKHMAGVTSFARRWESECLQGPLLVNLVTYWTQRTKLLIVGQETGGWLDNYDDIDAQLLRYEKFNLGENWGGPFWNITRKVEAALDVQRCGCAWTNLNRFDHDGYPPTGALLSALPELDFLVREEIRILQPDICLFYTNHKYDERVKALFPGIELADIEGLPHGHFARLVHPDLPDLTIRTPHPRTIRCCRWEGVFLDFIRSLRFP